MNLTAYPKVLQRAWGMTTALLRLGFSAEDIFFATAPVASVPGVLQVEVQLTTQGKAIGFPVGGTDLPQAEIEQQWTDLILKFNAKEYEPEVAQIVFIDVLDTFGGAVKLVTSLVASGIHPPSMPSAAQVGLS